MSQGAATGQPGSIADRLAAARRGRFVGRAAEVARFRAALLADVPPFAVLHLHGMGGVGKTTLLREFARIATECGRPTVRLDGRDIEPTATAFLGALRQALGLPESDELPPWPAAAVLLIDTYETLSALDSWLRELFVPQLPARSIVVCAGRNAPALAWRTDLAWAELAAIVPLQNLLPEEGATYLATRGIPAARHGAALAFTHGHPLALALIADLLGRGDDPASFDPQGEPGVVRVLLERLVREVPSARHRRALEVCALSRATTEPLLAHALGGEDTPALFDWLRHLTFVEQGRHGLFPHDLAREVLDADARWRDAAAYEQLGRRVYAYLRPRIDRQASGLERQRLQLDALYVVRHRAFMRTFFDWQASEAVHAVPTTPDDAAPILGMVRAHEGEESAAIAAHWLARQPGAFLTFRDDAGTCFGFMAHLDLGLAAPDDLARDPGAAAAHAFAQRHGPTAPGEAILHLRFWMHRDAYQAVTAAINLAAMNTVTHVMTRPHLAWNFTAMAAPDFWREHFVGLNWPRAAGADFVVAGHSFGAFAHDWRVEPPDRWMQGTPTPMPFDPAHAPSPPPPALDQADFARAVRQALRDYARPDRLADSPLLRTRLVADAAGRRATVGALQAALREAVESLRANPREVKLYRALWHTFCAPAPTQEAAAELLGLPFNTYRYQLTNGIARVAELLWRRECEGR